MKLRYTRIVTEDVASLARFYQQVTEVAPEGNDDYVELKTPMATLAICSKRTMDLHGAGAGIPAANRTTILEFEVDDVDKERTRIQSAVREFVMEPVNQPWGNRSMLFRDPDGNLINFFAPIARGDAVSTKSE